MITVVDYDAGNIRSVLKALDYIGEESILTRDIGKLLKADKVILPGVGSFGDAMKKLQYYNLVEPLHQIVENKTPLLGICLGLQLLFEKSQETLGVDGLGILKGEVVRFPDNNDFKIPHMGWNSIQTNSKSRLFQNIPLNSYVYFVHSYYLKAKKNTDVAAKSEYIVDFDAAVEHENVFATQFHPEKSGDVGLQILKNFARI